MKSSLLVFILLIMSFIAFVMNALGQTDYDSENGGFYMGCSIFSDSNSSINNRNVIDSNFLKQYFLGYYKEANIKNSTKLGIYGVDISHHQGKINWKEFISDTTPAKISFLIAKATEGTTFHDKQFNSNFDSAIKHGLIAGAYHFYIQTMDPIEQANNFISVVRLSKGNLIPIIDVEKNVIQNNKNTSDLLIDKSMLINNLKKYIGRIKEHYMIEPIIYTNEDFYRQFLSKDFSDCYFWIARYSKDPPICFEVGSYSFSDSCFAKCKKGCWQYSQHGSVKGIKENVDLDFMPKHYRIKWVIE